MFEPHVILHPTDFSDSAAPAFQYALQLASRFDSSLHLLNVAPAFGDDPIRGAYEVSLDEEAFYEQIRAHAAEQVQPLLDAAKANGVETTYTHEHDVAPGERIVQDVDDRDVDLVVMGTHGRGRIRRALLGSVAQEVVRHASCSVLTVRGDVTTHPQDWSRLLVPVDLSEFSTPLLRTAKELAASFQSRIDLLHVVEPLPFPVPLVGAVTIHDLIPDPSEQIGKELTALQQRVGGLPVDVNTHVHEGHAARTILDTAHELDSDAIIMASHGLSGLERALLGSVTSRVVRRAQCPVFTARVAPESEDAGTE
jgi:nucleotide-binding universal stress UspA family protein